MFKNKSFLDQGSANCGPWAKCGPRRQNMWPARYISAKIIVKKTIVKKGLLVKTCNWGLFQVIAYYLCSFIARSD